MVENSEKISFKRLRVLFIVFAILIGAAYSYVSRFSITSDTISYIDMAYEFINNDYKGLINGIWSPLYPAFLAMGFYIFKPDSFNEFPVLHLVNFLIYILALFSFDFFLLSLLQYHQKLKRLDWKNKLICFEVWALGVIGYSLFILSSLNIMGLWGGDPDVCFSIFIYLVSGIILKILSGNNSKSNFVTLGLFFGLGYLAKAPMFPLSFLYLFLLSRELKKNKLNILFSILVFMAVVSPYVYALSEYKGHFTIGESGKINYAWYVNNTPLFVHWQGGVNGEPIHPTRKLFNNPPVYEFATPVIGTYPPWTDPSYWYEGVKVSFDGIMQVASLCASSKIFIDIFLKMLGFLTGLSLLLFFLSKENKFSKYLILILPSLFAFLMFSLVHLEPRYIGAFIPLFFLGVLASFRFEKNKELLNVVNKTSITIFLMLILSISVINGREISGWLSGSQIHTEWEVAQSLKSTGINEGDNVAVIGYAIPYSPVWARVARVKIVSEILEKDANEFWSLIQESNTGVIKVFQTTGAKAIIAKTIPLCALKSDWKKLSNNGPYVKLLTSK
jgi:hypothetical protein